MVNLFDPFDPHMTFEVKPLINLVATNPGGPLECQGSSKNSRN